MADAAGSSGLQGKLILVVEDSYFLATEMKVFLQEEGAAVAGPVASVRDGLALVEREGSHIDAAVLDVNLRNETVFPVADALTARRVPLVFCTGYEQLLLGRPYVNSPYITKPIDYARLATVLSTVIAEPRSAP
jgi:CheY-like chemotaxis protein